MVMPTVYNDRISFLPLAEVVIGLQAWGQTRDHRELCMDISILQVVRGIKGISVLANSLDLVDGILVDYMHSAL